MTPEAFEAVLAQGEGPHVEFKRCGARPEADTFETICAFANRTGGSVYLGVLDDGTAQGLPARALLDIERNVVNIVNNPKLLASRGGGIHQGAALLPREVNRGARQKKAASRPGYATRRLAAHSNCNARVSSLTAGATY